MSTEFISILTPPGAALAHYDKTIRHDSQRDSHIPHVFLEAMSIREAVYVDEQKVPLEWEFDADDARSFHWVTYVSVGQSGGSASGPNTSTKRGSTANRLAVGTVRIVPPPHPPHAHPGLELKSGEAVSTDKGLARHDAANPGPESSFNPHNEPYIKIGRLAVLPTYRGLGLARLLMDTALNWAAGHPLEILPPMSAADREAKKMEGVPDEGVEKWNGLVLAHAQSYLEKAYKKWGWERDEGMGEWEEDGIMHLAMWKRLHVKRK